MASLDQAYKNIEDFCLHCGLREKEHRVEHTFQSAFEQKQHQPLTIDTRETVEDVCVCGIRRKNHPPFQIILANHDFIKASPIENVKYKKSKICVLCGITEENHIGMVHPFHDQLG